MKRLLTTATFLLMTIMGFSQTTEPVTDTLKFVGTATDVDGSIVKYEWKQVSGTPLTIINSDKPNAMAYIPAAGQYVVSLSVTDNSGATTTSNSDIITVDPADNIPPKAVITVLPGNRVKKSQIKP